MKTISEIPTKKQVIVAIIYLVAVFTLFYFTITIFG
jgi:preprotein translocase subunit YajC